MVQFEALVVWVLVFRLVSRILMVSDLRGIYALWLLLFPLKLRESNSNENSQININSNEKLKIISNPDEKLQITFDEIGIKKLYLDWFMNGRDENYFKKTSIVLNRDYKVSMEELLGIYNLFNKIRFDDPLIYLEKLEKSCKNNPGIRINECLDSYFGFCE